MLDHKTIERILNDYAGKESNAVKVVQTHTYTVALCHSAALKEVRRIETIVAPFHGESLDAVYRMPASPFDVNGADVREPGRYTVAIPNTRRKSVCSACNGIGEWDCENCDAKGAVVCGTCDGQKRLPCPACADNEEKGCAACSEGWQLCPTCKGVGAVSCPVCRGTGGVTCSVCEGRRQLYEKSVLVQEASWQRFSDFLAPLPLLKEVDKGEIEALRKMLTATTIYEDIGQVFSVLPKTLAYLKGEVRTSMRRVAQETKTQSVLKTQYEMASRAVVLVVYFYKGTRYHLLIDVETQAVIATVNPFGAMVSPSYWPLYVGAVLIGLFGVVSVQLGVVSALLGLAVPTALILAVGRILKGRLVEHRSRGEQLVVLLLLSVLFWTISTGLLYFFKP